MKREQARLEALRAMTYQEYLHTPEWQETQKAAITRAGQCCQRCGARGVLLRVGHTTLAHLGCEQEQDLLTLCEACFELARPRLVPLGSSDADDDPDGSQESVESLSFSQRATVGLASTLVGLGLPALLHAPLPAEVFGLALAIGLTVKSPELYHEVREHLPQPVAELLDGSMERRRARAESGEWSLWDRALGRHLRPSDAAPHVSMQDEPDRIDRPHTGAGGKTASKLPLDLHEEEGDEEELRRPRTGTLLFSEVLTRFRPDLSNIYLGTLPDGTALSCEARALCHVAFAGNTGGGKSSLMRMLLVQLCRAGARVLLLNPHYTHYDLENAEDWTPLVPYLYHDPMACRDYTVIGTYLKNIAQDVIPRRLEKRAQSRPVGKPYFIAIDELPSIVREIPDAPTHMRIILEEGRKVGVFLLSAAQDFLVKSIAPKAGGGSIRECYRTAYYVGGDATTAKVLLDMPPSLIPESDLGKGTVMLRSVVTKQARLVHVPYVDNHALYVLLGPSTYQAALPSTQAEEEERQPPIHTPRTTSTPAPSQALAGTLATLDIPTITTWWTNRQIDEATFLALLKVASAETLIGGSGNTRETAPQAPSTGTSQHVFPVSAASVSRVSADGNAGNAQEEVLETPSGAGSERIITGVFPVSTHPSETAISRSTLEALGVSMETVKLIKNMKEAKFPDRDISKMVELTGRKYNTHYRKVLEYLGSEKEEARA